MMDVTGIENLLEEYETTPFGIDFHNFLESSNVNGALNNDCHHARVRD